MTIEFEDYTYNTYIKQWPNWTGVIPEIGDTVVLHYGDNNEIGGKHLVIDRIIDGTNPDKITLLVR